MEDPKIEGISTDESTESVTEERLAEMLDERLDVEALAQMVEHLDFSKNMSQKLTSAFREVRSRSGRNGNILEGVQREIRDLIMDVALLKRALTSIGQVGVMERRRIERELIRELFPPSQPRQGTGLVISSPNQAKRKSVDCENRLQLCKAACCRIFNVGLTPQEVEGDRFDWDPRRPYALQKNRQGCVHIQGGGCACSIYDDRPRICETYSCEKDGRIWADFEKKVVNPDLKKRLDTLDVSTAAPFLSGSSRMNSGRESSSSNKTAIASEPKSSSTSQEVAIPGMAGNMPSNRNGPMAVAGQNKQVDPPNFDDLRELMIPLPENKFVPPVDDEKNA